MKELKNTLDAPGLSGMRADGNTTRQADYAVQLLFEGHRVAIRDHHDYGRNQNSNKRLYTIVYNRIKTEHRGFMEHSSMDLELNRMHLIMEIIRMEVKLKKQKQ